MSKYLTQDLIGFRLIEAGVPSEAWAIAQTNPTHLVDYYAADRAELHKKLVEDGYVRLFTIDKFDHLWAVQ